MTEQPRVQTRAQAPALRGSARVTSLAAAWAAPEGVARMTLLGTARAADRAIAQVTTSALIHGKA